MVVLLYPAEQKNKVRGYFQCSKFNTIKRGKSSDSWAGSLSWWKSGTWTLFFCSDFLFITCIFSPKNKDNWAILLIYCLNNCIGKFLPSFAFMGICLMSTYRRYLVYANRSMNAIFHIIVEVLLVLWYTLANIIIGRYFIWKEEHRRFIREGITEQILKLFRVDLGVQILKLNALDLLAFSFYHVHFFPKE